MESDKSFLKVSCLAKAEAAAADHQAEIVVTLLSADMRAPSFASVEALQKHICFYFHDQESILPLGMQEAVADLIYMGRIWQENKLFPRTLVHCHGGVSRSTAATYILMCASMPDVAPEEHFVNLLRIAPKPWPNLRMVTIADGILGAGGKMIAPLKTYREANPNRLAVYRRLNRGRGIIEKVKR